MSRPAAIIGGSTIAAAAGIDPWCSRVELFYRLRGVIVEPENEAMTWGKAIEPAIFERLAADGIDCRAGRGVELRDPARQWLVGHPDGIAADGRIVEAKLTAGHAYRTDAPLPIGWQAQAQTYMRLSGAERAVVAVLVAGTRLDVRELAYNADAAELLVERAAELVAMVERGEPPAPDGSESARDTLAAVYGAQEEGTTLTLSAEGWSRLKLLRLLREQRKEVERQEQECENALKAEMGEAETLLSPHGTTVAHWKAVTSRRLDTAALKAARPDIYTEYLTESTTRRFTLT